MTTAQVVETSVTVNNSPIQDCVHLDDQTQPTNSYAIAFKSISLPKYVSCNYSSRKELFFKRKNKSLTANGAKAKVTGF